jgi:hypothetical protein
MAVGAAGTVDQEASAAIAYGTPELAAVSPCVIECVTTHGDEGS